MCPDKASLKVLAKVGIAWREVPHFGQRKPGNVGLFVTFHVPAGDTNFCSGPLHGEICRGKSVKGVDGREFLDCGVSCGFLPKHDRHGNVS